MHIIHDSRQDQHISDQNLAKMNLNKYLLLLLVYPWLRICWCTLAAISCMSWHGSANAKDTLLLNLTLSFS